jgi:hypothetical protein
MSRRYGKPSTSPTRAPDSALAPEAALAFLDALAPGGVFVFQSFPDRKTAGRGGRTLVGTAASATQWLREGNQKGHAVCVTINKVKGRRRASHDVCAIRALFVDLDGAPLGPVLAAPVPPSILVESSPGRFHAYWLIDELPLSEFTRAQKQLAERFGGDPSVCDLPRVMRLPGYWHQKGTPFVSTLMECDSARRWTWTRFAELMDLRAASAQPALPEGQRNNGLFRNAQVLLRNGTTPDHLPDELMRMNVATCAPPLPSSEVESIARSAISRHGKRYSRLHHVWFDSIEFRRLSIAAQLLLVVLLRNAAGHPDGQVTLTRTDAAARRISAHLRRKGLGELEAAKFLEYTSRGRGAVNGLPARPDRFRIRLPR